VFLSKLILESDDKRPDFWIVRAPLIWQDPTYGRIEVPVGFLTDLASIPRALRNISSLDPDGKSRRPAVVHDWLYAWQGFGKDRSDEFLRTALIDEGVPHFDAESFYEAVHLFGADSWKEDAARGLPNSFESSAAFMAWSGIQP
jgi:Protein of unknown function (DUF1353)